MEVLAAIRTMLAVRSYQDRPVPTALLQRILEAGRLTGSSLNLQPWAFVTVQDRETLKQLAGLAMSGPYVAQAGGAIVVAVDRNSRYGVSDGSRAIQSMLLTAWSEGVGGNWVGFAGMEGVRELLGVPTEMDVLAVLSLGYPAQRIGKGIKKRRDLADIAHKEHWGQRWG